MAAPVVASTQLYALSFVTSIQVEPTEKPAEVSSFTVGAAVASNLFPSIFKGFIFGVALIS
jgi:hypothetical protein